MINNLIWAHMWNQKIIAKANTNLLPGQQLNVPIRRMRVHRSNAGRGRESTQLSLNQTGPKSDNMNPK